MNKKLFTKKIGKMLFLSLMVSSTVAFLPLNSAFADGPGDKKGDTSGQSTQSSESYNQQTNNEDDMDEFGSFNGKVKFPMLLSQDGQQAGSKAFTNLPKKTRAKKTYVKLTPEGELARALIKKFYAVGERNKIMICKEGNEISKVLGFNKFSRTSHRQANDMYNNLALRGTKFILVLGEYHKNPGNRDKQAVMNAVNKVENERKKNNVLL